MPTKSEAEKQIKNRFAILNAIDVSGHTEKKNGLTYLSWAWAWTEFKKIFPDSYYTIYENNDGLNYFHDGKTCWVKTGVTLVDGDFKLEHIEMLPIMDFKNKSIDIKSVDSMNVNKAIQRSLTKAIARHGLGCYIYAGEDLPEETEEAKAEREAALQKRLELCSSITKEIKRITANFDNQEKRAFSNQNIFPIIGRHDYNECVDNSKLTILLENLKSA